MPKFYYRKEIKRAIKKYYTIPDVGEMLRDAVSLVEGQFGVADYLCVLT